MDVKTKINSRLSSHKISSPKTFERQTLRIFSNNGLKVAPAGQEKPDPVILYNRKR